VAQVRDRSETLLKLLRIEPASIQQMAYDMGGEMPSILFALDRLTMAGLVHATSRFKTGFAVYEPTRKAGGWPA